MNIFIDTSMKDKIVVSFDDQRHEIEAKQNASQMLLPFILNHLKETGQDFSTIKSIKVATGPGSFTGLRVGVSVAQTLGWSLNIPVNGEDMHQKKFIQIDY